MSQDDIKKLQTLASTPKKRKPQPKKPKSSPNDTVEPSLELKPAEVKREVLFEPNPGPQTEFLAASEQEVLYGGAAGGGKSFALVVDPIRYFNHPRCQALLIRRTMPELKELINVSKNLYPKFDPGAKFTERDSTWRFSSGAWLWMSYLERDDDVLKYQGQAYNWVGFDELTQWPTPKGWDYLRSRLRTSRDTGLPLCMRACVDEGEVLTELGWKSIQDVKVGEKVQSVDERGNLVLRPVTEFHEYDVEEDLVRIRKKNLYMSMTPDHRVVFEKFNSKSPELTRFNEHKGKSISVLRSSRGYKGGDERYTTPVGFDQNSYAEFLGLYVAEGSVCQTVRKGNYKVVITQNKTKNHGFVRKVMERSGCNVCYCKNGDFQITNQELWSWLKLLGKSHQKHFPREFLDKANLLQLKLAFDAYALGDGHWQSKTSVSLFTTSVQLADDLQEMCVKLGYKTQRAFEKSPHPNHKDRWIIYVSLRDPLTKVDKNPLGRNDVKYESYKGKVYCLSVEGTENFVLRQKGSVWVSGNTSNPGGPGHQWVKKMFVDPEVPGKAFWAKDIETGETLVWAKNSEFAQKNDLVGKPMFKRRFIPATLFDNPYLSEDGNYEANLLSLPEHQRKQLLEGSWDVAEGAAFPEWNRKIHVVEPFEIPKNWVRFRSCDYGYGSYAAVLWFAVDPATDQLIVYRELKTKQVLAVDLAHMILELEEGERIRYGVLDSSLWHNRGDTGPSLAEQMIRQGCLWRPSDRSKGSRVASKNEIHRRLQVDPYTEQPRMVFFKTCLNAISEVPSIPLDRKNPEDVDTNVDDHVYDAIRYGVMSRPYSNLAEADPFASRQWTPADPVMGY